MRVLEEGVVVGDKVTGGSKEFACSPAGFRSADLSGAGDGGPPGDCARSAGVCEASALPSSTSRELNDPACLRNLPPPGRVVGWADTDRVIGDVIACSVVVGGPGAAVGRVEAERGVPTK